MDIRVPEASICLGALSDRRDQRTPLRHADSPLLWTAMQLFFGPVGPHQPHAPMGSRPQEQMHHFVGAHAPSERRKLQTCSRRDGLHAVDEHRRHDAEVTAAFSRDAEDLRAFAAAVIHETQREVCAAKRPVARSSPRALASGTAHLPRHVDGVLESARDDVADHVEIAWL